jgi:type IV pilus assembly protein PilB
VSRKRIGEILQERGLAEDLLEAALAVQATMPGTKLGVALVQLGAVTEEDVAQALALQLGLPYIDPEREPVDPVLVWRINRNLAAQRQVIPIKTMRDGRPLVAMADPHDHETYRELEFAFSGRVHRAVASPAAIRRAIQTHFSVESVAGRLLDDVKPELRTLTVSPTYLELDAGKIQNHIKKGGIRTYVDLLDFLLINAIERGASDIHLEPQPDSLRVRYRVDGMLRETVRLPSWAMGPLTGRVKVVGNLNVAERRRPQDGKATAVLGGKRVDLRIATMPSQYGESVVIRILDPAMLETSLRELGWPDAALKTWYQQLARPRGLLLVVGPTGSGKSTTLYSSITRLNRESTSIVTVEDPIEYSIAGITQVQVNEKAGINFSTAVRSMLRQDPNVMVIGEIRDPETAAAAVDAAGTGHLVLSTLHTSNAVAAVTRMLDLNVPGYLLGAAVTGIVAQRLVRKVCSYCSLPADPTPEDWDRVGLPPLALGDKARRAGPGCPHCQYMGYSGRIGLFELLNLSNDLTRRIQDGFGSEAELWMLARSNGMRTIYEDAIDKIRAGETTLEELARVVPVTDYPIDLISRTLEEFTDLHGAADQVDVPTEAPPPVATQDVMRTLDSPLQETTVTEEQPDASPRARARVLVVDDAEEILQLVTLTLEDDYDVIQARDGVEALDLVQEELPDLVVLDVMMPRKTGYEVVAELRDGPHKRLPVLMLSARGETAHIKKGFYAGADDYLPKPFDPEELLLRVRALLRRAG